MAITLFDAFLPEVQVDALFCPDPTAILAIRNAAIEFCGRSRVWQYEHAAVNVVADTPSYAFVPPADAVVVEILQAWYDNLRIWPKQPDALVGMYANWKTAESQRPNYVTQLDERNFRLVPIPTVALASGITMDVALKPTRAATGIETRIYEEYAEAIGHGAKWRLMEKPKQPWSNATLAAYHKQMFDDAIGAAYNRVRSGFGRGGSVRMRVGRR